MVEGKEGCRGGWKVARASSCFSSYKVHAEELRKTVIVAGGKYTGEKVRMKDCGRRGLKGGQERL